MTHSARGEWLDLEEYAKQVGASFHSVRPTQRTWKRSGLPYLLVEFYEPSGHTPTGKALITRRPAVTGRSGGIRVLSTRGEGAARRARETILQERAERHAAAELEKELWL